MNFKIRFRISIVTAILLIILAITAVTLGNVWVISSKTADKTAATLFQTATQTASERLNRFRAETQLLVNMGAQLEEDHTLTTDSIGDSHWSVLFSALQDNPSLYSVYYGMDDGTFSQLIHVRYDERINLAHNAPKLTRWILRAITTSDAKDKQPGAKPERVQIWTYLDAQRLAIGKKVEKSPKYDPRERPWFENAMRGGARLSVPYEFFSLKAPGITSSRRTSANKAVFGVDITLTALSNFIAELKISDNGGIILIDEKDRILSISPSFGKFPPLTPVSKIDSAAVKAAITASKDTAAKGPKTIHQNGVDYVVQVTNWEGDGRRIRIVAVAPSSDFVGHIHTMQNQIILYVFLSLLLIVPCMIIFSNRVARNLSDLVSDTERVRKLDFSGDEPRNTHILEFHQLRGAFLLMKDDLSDQTDALSLSEKKLSRIVELGIAMAAERDSDRLMEMVLNGAKDLANADGGTLYTISEDKMLEFKIVQNDSLGISLGGTSGNEVNLPPVAMLDDGGEPNHKNVVSHTVHAGEAINIADAYEVGEFDFQGTRAFDERNGYRSKSFMTVPLRPRGGECIGALQLVNALDEETKEPVPFSNEIQTFVEALAAQAATSLYNRDLINAQERLMDALIQLIAGAIDIKSPYTGGHCERVSELAIMLAEEASQVSTGPLGEFKFETDQEWREFRIGAWLHDCGKVVTPEYVVDKATKLETIYNRIGEIRMRFEVLLRDADIERLESIVAGTDIDAAQKALDARKAELLDDFAFVAECNVGGEFMAPEKLERLKSIAQNIWLRHFDDRLGLSRDESERHSGPTVELPATEKLLDDKPEHVIPRRRGVHKMYDDLDFKVDIPEHLYNLGEMHNLSISRGTLTDKERFKINEHIMQTIVMLEHLPLPKHLRRVPEYAGTHHEALTGTGYPRKLGQEDLSVPARIMAIADIFEALTAADRPYKEPKSLSEAVKILNFFKKDGHIDPDLFDLFLTTGTYKRYADHYLTPEQMDEVDIDQYLGPVDA